MLSHAVGTTFTLTLEAALAVPLSFARRGFDTGDEVGVLGAVRQAVDRVDVFAQSGYIALGHASDLVTVLEPMIHPVSMRRGLFHPKVWFLEFAADEERRYRFICSSRNLTSDRTWDAVVSLDGRLGEHAQPANDGMVRLMRWLIADGRTSPRMPQKRTERIEQLAQTWTRVEWEYPDDVRRLATHVLGIGGDSAPRLNGTDALIVSPFVTDDGLARLRARDSGSTTLVSRPEQLDRLSPETLDGLTTRVLDDFVDQALAEAEDSSATAGDLSGLHAKVVVHDRAVGDSTLLIGSANATNPAWTANVEAMVELDGPTKRLGTAVIAASLAPLLEDYTTTGGAIESADETAERELDAALRRIAQRTVHVRVLRDPYSVRVWGDHTAEAPPGASLSWRLLTQRDLVPGPLPRHEDPYSSGPLGLEQITPFIVLSLSDGTRRRQTLVIAELHDDVPERADAIVASHLTEPGAFARFVRLMLLPPEGVRADSDARFGVFHSGFGSGVAEDGSGLLELLVRAAASNLDGLAEIDRVLAHFSEAERDRALPPGFLEVWASVSAASKAGRE